MWKILTAASTALMLIGTPALAQMDWDANQDASIDETEFGTGFGEGDAFGTWDTDHDQQLTEEEWTAGMGESADQEQFGAYSDWDEDQSGALSQDEFNQGVFGAYDEDDDAMWSEEEFGAYQEEARF